MWPNPSEFYKLEENYDLNGAQYESRGPHRFDFYDSGERGRDKGERERESNKRRIKVCHSDTPAATNGKHRSFGHSIVLQ